MRLTLLALVFAGLTAAAAAPQTITGIITDTMCGAEHTMMKDKADAACVGMCVKGSHDYALYDGKAVWKLSDQKTPARFLAKNVRVTGVANPKTMTIKVTAIEAAE